VNFPIHSPAKNWGKTVLEFASAALLYTVNCMFCQSGVALDKVDVRAKAEWEAD